MEKDIGKPTFHFVIPYPWKNLLAGLFWMSTGTFIAFTAMFFFIFGLTYYFWVGLVGTFLLSYGIYYLFKHVEIKFDKIKSPIEITITETTMQFKKDRLVYNNSFTSVKSVRVILDDKQLEMKCQLEEPDEDNATWWRFAFRRREELGEVDYNEFAEQKFIPAAKYMIERIRELNPHVEITWEDKRRKYR